jgi:general transcription factor 3C polypeptide 2
VQVKIHDDESSSSGEISKDFVMHVGGSVWAMEWCPRVHGNPDAQAKCEVIRSYFFVSLLRRNGNLRFSLL